jgi:hypothetical protein
MNNRVATCQQHDPVEHGEVDVWANKPLDGLAEICLGDSRTTQDEGQHERQESGYGHLRRVWLNNAIDGAEVHRNR